VAAPAPIRPAATTTTTSHDFTRIRCILPLLEPIKPCVLQYTEACVLESRAVKSSAKQHSRTLAQPIALALVHSRGAGDRSVSPLNRAGRGTRFHVGRGGLRSERRAALRVRRDLRGRPDTA